MNPPSSQTTTYPPMDTRELLAHAPVEIDMDQCDGECTRRRCIACDAVFTDGRGGVCASCMCRGSVTQFMQRYKGARSDRRRTFWIVAVAVGVAIVVLLVAGVCR